MPGRCRQHTRRGIYAGNLVPAVPAQVAAVAHANIKQLPGGLGINFADEPSFLRFQKYINQRVQKPEPVVKAFCLLAQVVKVKNYYKSTFKNKVKV